MFFSVKTTVKIMGKVYTPCVCYPVTDILAPTIDKMVAEGKAYRYANKVFFQNGKVIEKKPVVKESLTTEKKKSKKEKAVPVADTVHLAEEAETVPSPEEVADDLGGF